MADTAGNHYGPLDVEASPEAEDYTESTWYRFHRESGVLSGGGVTFDGRVATLAPIEAKVYGGFYFRTAPLSGAALTSPATSGANPRRDMLVLRSVLTTGSGSSAIPGSTVPLILQGNPAATPADPVPGARDEPLWSWQVPGSGGSAVTNQTDLRRYLDLAGPRRRAYGYYDGTSGPGAVVIAHGLGAVPKRVRITPSNGPVAGLCQFFENSFNQDTLQVAVSRSDTGAPFVGQNPVRFWWEVEA